MKTIVINADPKRKGINAQLMKSALKGAESVGAETQYVDLYKMKISGCRVCLICKNDDSVCKCYWRPQLKQSEDLLEMLNGEVVIDTFSNISKNMYANKSEEEIRKKEKQLELDLEKVYDYACRLSSK